ncbi:MAG: histidine phosphatase family protein [Burkholderia sp.]|nr:histidine phosphatase family protein [Burkholderia sp.]
MDLLLIRHSPVDINDSVCYGCSDVPLALSEEVAAQSALERLALVSAPLPHIIWSSPLIRCSKVGKKLAESLDVPFQCDICWKEINFGSWEMNYWNDISRIDLDAWAANLIEFCTHGGESVAQFTKRISQIVEKVTAINLPQWAFTHLGVIRIFTEIVLRLPIGTLLKRQVSLGGIVWLRRNTLYDIWEIVFWDK